MGGMVDLQARYDELLRLLKEAGSWVQSHEGVSLAYFLPYGSEDQAALSILLAEVDETADQRRAEMGVIIPAFAELRKA